MSYVAQLDAAMRHLLLALDGVERDHESAESHVAHALARLAILLDAQAFGTLVDDRPPRVRHWCHGRRRRPKSRKRRRRTSAHAK
jgi:hypothetical protein